MKYFQVHTENAAKSLVAAFRYSGKRAYYVCLTSSNYEVRVW